MVGVQNDREHKKRKKMEKRDLALALIIRIYRTQDASCRHPRGDHSKYFLTSRSTSLQSSKSVGASQEYFRH